MVDEDTSQDIRPNEYYSLLNDIVSAMDQLETAVQRFSKISGKKMTAYKHDRQVLRLIIPILSKLPEKLDDLQRVLGKGLKMQVHREKNVLTELKEDLMPEKKSLEQSELGTEENVHDPEKRNNSASYPFPKDPNGTSREVVASDPDPNAEFNSGP